MPLPIPQVSQDSVEGKRVYEEDEIITNQHKELSSYRKFMANIIKLNNNIYRELESSEDIFVNLFYNSVDARYVTNSLMSSWYNGYWVRKNELRRDCAHISEATFNRFLKTIIEQGLVKRTVYEKDHRYAVLMPTKKFVRICHTLHQNRVIHMYEALLENNNFNETDNIEYTNELDRKMHELSLLLKEISFIIQKSVNKIF